MAEKENKTESFPTLNDNNRSGSGGTIDKTKIWKSGAEGPLTGGMSHRGEGQIPINIRGENGENKTIGMKGIQEDNRDLEGMDRTEMDRETDTDLEGTKMMDKVREEWDMSP